MPALPQAMHGSGGHPASHRIHVRPLGIPVSTSYRYDIELMQGSSTPRTDSVSLEQMLSPSTASAISTTFAMGQQLLVAHVLKWFAPIVMPIEFLQVRTVAGEADGPAVS